MSKSAELLATACKHAEAMQVSEAFEGFRAAAAEAANDSERLAVLDAQLKAEEGGLSREGFLRAMAVAIFAGSVIVAAALVVLFARVNVPGEPALDWLVVGWALGTVGSGLLTMLVLLRVARAMDLLHQINLRQAVVRLERRMEQPTIR